MVNILKFAVNSNKVNLINNNDEIQPISKETLFQRLIILERQELFLK